MLCDQKLFVAICNSSEKFDVVVLPSNAYVGVDFWRWGPLLTQRGDWVREYAVDVLLNLLQVIFFIS